MTVELPVVSGLRMKASLSQGTLKVAFASSVEVLLSPKTITPVPKSQHQTERRYGFPHLQWVGSPGYTRPSKQLRWVSECTVDSIVGVLQCRHRLTCSCYRIWGVVALLLFRILAFRWLIEQLPGSDVAYTCTSLRRCASYYEHLDRSKGVRFI